VGTPFICAVLIPYDGFDIGAFLNDAMPPIVGSFAANGLYFNNLIAHGAFRLSDVTGHHSAQYMPATMETGNLCFDSRWVFPREANEIRNCSLTTGIFIVF